MYNHATWLPSYTRLSQVLLLTWSPHSIPIPIPTPSSNAWFLTQSYCNLAHWPPVRIWWQLVQDCTNAINMSWMNNFSLLHIWSSMKIQLLQYISNLTPSPVSSLSHVPALIPMETQSCLPMRKVTTRTTIFWANQWWVSWETWVNSLTHCISGTSFQNINPGWLASWFCHSSST